MQLFQQTNREYVPSVDLTTLGNTFNTLEQGHKDAVTAASSLKAAYAQLDLNPEEAAWRDAQIAQIQTTLDNNTNFGNAYGALDDIIAKQGDMMSDKELLTKLQANKDYKAYRDEIKNSNLTEEQKEFYLEANQYNGHEQYDEKGNFKENYQWKPKDTFVDNVDLSNLIVKGIQIAAKERGSISQTRWIDTNGNVTTDPSKAYDGEIYNSVSGSWEKLGRDKILAGIRAMIETTPGAKASLAQDFKIAAWRHNKQVKANNGNPVIDEFTDENGLTLNEEQYLMKRISPALQAAEYNNTDVKTTYGEGLKTYKAAQKAAQYSKIAEEEHNKLFGYQSDNTPIITPYKYGSKVVENKQNSENVIKDIYKQISGKDLNLNIASNTSNGFNDMLSYLQEEAKKKNMSKEDIINMSLQFKSAVRQYEEANFNYNEIIKDLSKEQQDGFDFLTRADNGFIIKEGNKWDNQVIRLNNQLFSKGTETVRIYLNQDVFNELGKTLKDSFIIGNQGGKYYIDLNKTQQNKSILLANLLNGYNFSTISLDAQGNEINDRDYKNISVSESGHTKNALPFTSTTYKTKESIIKDINDVYTRAKNENEKIINDRMETITVSNNNYSFDTFDKSKNKYLFDTGIFDKQTYETNAKALDEDMPRKIMGGDYTQMDIYAIDENGSLRRVEESSKRKEIGERIKSAYGNKRFTINAAANPILGAGSNITITSKPDDDLGYKGKGVEHYFIPDLIDSNSANEFENNPKFKAASEIAIGNETRQKINLTSAIDTPIIGAQYIQCNGFENYIFHSGDNTFKLDREQATNVNEAFKQYINIKDAYDVRAFDLNNKNVVESLNNSLNAIEEQLSNAIGKEKANIISQSLILDLLE